MVLEYKKSEGKMKDFFNDKDLKRIKEAVARAEQRTSGEIVVTFIRQSDSYAIFELLAAVIVGFLVLNIMLVFYPSIDIFIAKYTWSSSARITSAFIGLVSFIAIALSYLIFNNGFFDRIIVPKKVMKSKVSDRAYLHFIKAGVVETAERNGILIFISYLERRVMIIADRGINEKIEQEKWGELIDEIILSIKRNRLADGIVSAVKRCGYILEEHFPKQYDDKNELKDDMTILER